jgi:hypothetical protein
LIFCAEGRLFIRPDGKHGNSSFVMFDLKPEAFKQMGPAWAGKHPNTTSYFKPMSYPFVDGRLFVRGYDGIYCYDLRKPRG